MAAHPRLGISSPRSVQEVAASRDLLFAILKHFYLVVPDDVPTFAAALRRAAPWQRVKLRTGEHLVDAREAGDPGSSVVHIKSPIRLSGEEGAVLRGTIVISAACAGGSIRDVRIDDAGDCSLRIEGGSWELSNLRLRCAHGAALKLTGSARAELFECVLGGEGEDEMDKHVTLSAYGSVQIQGLRKLACYGLVVRDKAEVLAHQCLLRDCSEAAVLVAHSARCHLRDCRVRMCTAAFISGQGRGRALELNACVIEKTASKFWADADRPRAVVIGGDNVNLPRGYEDSDSDDSLEHEEYADLENLMAELDDQALQEAGR